MGAIDSTSAILAPFWQAADDRLLLLSQASHAYSIMQAVLRRRGRADPVFWFPAYFCGGALDSLRVLTPRLRFYPVMDDFAPDWAACEEMARAEPPELVSLPHFFGQQADVDATRRFADRHGALLHEDNAHSLLPYGDAGRAGDFVTYSPRKYLQIADGGLLVIRGRNLVDDADAIVAAMPRAAYSPLRWQWRQLRQRLLPRSPASLGRRTIDWDPPVVPHFREIWMSRASRSVLIDQVSTGRIADTMAARRLKTREIGAELAAAHALRHVTPHADAVPYWTAFRGADEAATLAALNAMRAAGIPANTWPRLPPEVKSDTARHAAALRIRRTLIRVPTG